MRRRKKRHDPGPQPLRTALSAQKAKTNPGNTAGPVLPHRPSETPPVLRNHREGLVTCSTVATRTEKTTPVGSLVTQRKHRRFPTPHLRLLSPIGGPWDHPATGLGGSVVAHVTRSVGDACGIGVSWLIGLPRRAGARLHATSDAEARWWHWQVTERCGGLVRQYRDARFEVLRHYPAVRDELGVDLARPRPGAARLPVPRRPLMAAGRPHGPNDPSLMSSLETAVRKVRRPGPAELAWNWRWELGIFAMLASDLRAHRERIRPSRTLCRHGGRAGG